MKNKIKNADDIYQIMKSNKTVRKAIVKRSMPYFFHYFFPHYVEYPTAPFQKEIMGIAQEFEKSMFVLSAFRGSGKSTLMTMAFPIWAIISEMKAKYILIVSQTQPKAQTLLGHIRNELENNEALKFDMGPFVEERSGWNSVSLLLKQYGAKITAMSIDQSARSTRHLNHRPDIIIIDDAEDGDSVKTQENRDKLYGKLVSDFIPAGHKQTKIVVIGSILHPDCLVNRLQKRIGEGKINGISKKYPIIDGDDNSMWSGKFPDMESINAEKARGIPDREWQIEYMLNYVPEADQIIKEEWIKYEDDLTFKSFSKQYSISAVDPAVTEEKTSDYTAIVSGEVYKDRKTSMLRVLPFPINRKMEAPEIIETIINQSLLLGNGSPTRMCVEGVSAQKYLIQMLQNTYQLPVEEFSPEGQDKKARLMTVSGFIKSGRVVFPRKGCETLLNQMLNLGHGEHDDLCDALVMLIMMVFKREDGHGVVIPSPYHPIKSIETPEQEAERLARDKGEIYRGGPDIRALHMKRLEDQRKKDLELYKKEEYMMFRKMMSPYLPAGMR